MVSETPIEVLDVGATDLKPPSGAQIAGRPSPSAELGRDRALRLCLVCRRDCTASHFAALPNSWQFRTGSLYVDAGPFGWLRSATARYAAVLCRARGPGAGQEAFGGSRRPRWLPSFPAPGTAGAQCAPHRTSMMSPAVAAPSLYRKAAGRREATSDDAERLDALATERSRSSSLSPCQTPPSEVRIRN